MSENKQTWSQNGGQNRAKIDEKVVPTALPQNTPHFDGMFLILLLFVKRPIATKHCKNQYKTMIFASPLDAPRFTQNIKNRSKKSSKILSN